MNALQQNNKFIPAQPADGIRLAQSIADAVANLSEKLISGGMAERFIDLVEIIDIQKQDGQQFTAGRLGSYTITKDPMRGHGLRVLLGPWTVFDKTTIAAAAR